MGGGTDSAGTDPVREPEVDLELTTADSVRIHARHFSATAMATATAAGAARDLVVVMAHGFTNSGAAPTAARIAGRLRRGAGVLALDFRGHGRSGGLSSVGRDEHLDIDAAVAAARALGYLRVAVLGFSMGGAVALRHTALGEHRPDAVVAVSAPSRWFVRETVPMRRVHWLLEHPWGIVSGRALGVRLGPVWPDIPPTPLEMMPRIAPTPLLLVHGTADHYFGPRHAEALRDAALDHGDLWLETGMAHAESGTGPVLVDRLLAWMTTNPAGQHVESSRAGRPG